MIVLGFIVGRRVLAATAGTLLGICSGCAQTVMLGTECPETEGACVTPSDDSDDLGAGKPRDAGTRMDAELNSDLDSSEQPPADTGAEEHVVAVAAPQDAEPDATPLHLVPLGLLNPGFQRNPGVPAGDVVLSNVVNAIPVVGIVISDLPSWYACWVGSVNSVTWELDPDAGTPLQKGDYLSLVLNSVFNTKIEPARQKLPMPMQAGVTYALEMDVLGLPDNGSQLHMEIRGHTEDCGGDGTMLVRAEIRPEHSWTTLCMQFTPQKAFSHFLIGPGYTGPQPSTNARVRLDSLRQVSACPAPP